MSPTPDLVNKIWAYILLKTDKGPVVNNKPGCIVYVVNTYRVYFVAVCFTCLCIYLKLLSNLTSQ